MKKFLAVMLCVLFLVTFGGCNFDKSTPPPTAPQDNVSTPGTPKEPLTKPAPGK